MSDATRFEPAFVQSLHEVAWFSRCGQELPHNLPLGAVRVTTLKKAARQWGSNQWEDTTLEARNLLTDFLSMRASGDYQNWNEITRQAKVEVVQPLAEKYWQPFMQQQGLDVNFLHCVQWDILALCMEHAYRQQHGLPQFFLELLKVYAAGHMPCGWEGGKYPKGRLLVW